MLEFQSQTSVRSDMGDPDPPDPLHGFVPAIRLLSFVIHGDDLPEILGKTTAQESKKSTYGWYASFQNA